MISIKHLELMPMPMKNTFLLVPKLSFGTALPSKLCFIEGAAVPRRGTVVEAKLRRHGVPKWNFGTRKRGICFLLS